MLYILKGIEAMHLDRQHSNKIVLFVLFILLLNSLCACGTSTRIIKNHVVINEVLNGKSTPKGSLYSESITESTGPTITRPSFLLINLTFFPLITLTGPLSDTMDARQKKAVLYYSPSGDLVKRSDVEVALSLSLNSPMMIAQAMGYEQYLDDVFDFVWARAAADMAGIEGLNKYNVIECTVPIFQTQRNFVLPSMSPETAMPDTDKNILIIERENGDLVYSEKNNGERILMNFLHMYGIGEIRVQLWAESHSATGKLLAAQNREYSISPASKGPLIKHLNIN